MSPHTHPPRLLFFFLCLLLYLLCSFSFKTGKSGSNCLYTAHKSFKIRTDSYCSSLTSLICA